MTHDHCRLFGVFTHHPQLGLTHWCTRAEAELYVEENHGATIATPIEPADYDRVRALLDEARVIIDTAHMAERGYGWELSWNERRRAWLERCKEVAK